MFNFVLTTLVALGVVFGGGATTVALAQGAQPDQALYPVKTWSEEVRLGWATDSQTELGLALQFTERRAEEIRAMLQAGGDVPGTVLSRYENQEQQVLRLAAGMPDDLAVPALERVRDRARQQEHTMAQLQLQNALAIQTRDGVRTMLQTQAQIAQQGIENPGRLREQLRLRDQIGQTTPPQGFAIGTDSPLTGSNPWTTGVPTPGSSYGPGASQNPWTDTTPVPGSGYGPGPGTGDCATCTAQPGYGGPWGQPAPGSGGPKGP